MRAKIGQHFLRSRKHISIICDAADIRSRDVVADLGAGRGAISKELLKRNPKSLYVVEIDECLCRSLQKKLQHENVVILCRNLLEVLPSDEFDKIVSSPPYYISSKLIERLAMSRFKRAVLVLQSEYVGKMLAKPGTRKYGWLSAISQACFRIEVISFVPKECFDPPPRVDSLVISLAQKRRASQRFIRLVRSAFLSRRRKVKNSSLAKIVKETQLREKRVFELTPEDFVVILRDNS